MVDPLDCLKIRLAGEVLAAVSSPVDDSTFRISKPPVEWIIGDKNSLVCTIRPSICSICCRWKIFSLIVRVPEQKIVYKACGTMIAIRICGATSTGPKGKPFPFRRLPRQTSHAVATPVCLMKVIEILPRPFCQSFRIEHTFLRLTTVASDISAG